jgi:hypothetical protein
MSHQTMGLGSYGGLRSMLFNHRARARVAPATLQSDASEVAGPGSALGIGEN